MTREPSAYYKSVCHSYLLLIPKMFVTGCLLLITYYNSAYYSLFIAHYKSAYWLSLIVNLDVSEFNP